MAFTGAYRKAVLEYCVRQLRSREEGEDATQAVFLNAYRSLAAGTEPRSERAWLFKIAEHVVSYRRRTNSRRMRFETPVDPDDLAYLAVAPLLEDAPDLSGLADSGQLDRVHRLSQGAGPHLHRA